MTNNGNTPNEVEPTSAANWREPRLKGYVVTLPSGNVARIRPVALDVLITTGKLPDLLTPIAAKTLWTEVETADIADASDMAKGMAELFGVVCRAAFIEPKIADDEPGEGEISLEDIDFQDKAAVFQLATQPAEVLRKFREQQARGVASVPDGENEPVKAKRSRRAK